jgi:predicted 2-oxoglutarate/Fe(II)-dependent dioxygenase YbiX
MKTKHLGNGIVLFEDLLDQAALDTIDLSLIYSQSSEVLIEKENGRNFLHNGHEIVDEIDLDNIPARFMEKIETIPYFETLNNALYLALVEYCKLFPVAVECITNYAGTHFIRYTKGCKMGPHSDTSLPYEDGTVTPKTLATLGNTITASIILNDSFTGGSVYFPAGDIEVTPGPGSALMYPSNYMGAHEVREVTSGVRWAYLGFFCHGDRSLTTDEPQHKHAARHAWVEKLKTDVDEHLATRLNANQKKVV